MNVNEKGSVGLIEVIRDLSRKGFECFTPLHDYSSVDLIVMDKSWHVFKLQVKYRTRYGNIINVGFSTVINGKKVASDLSAIDGWAVYCPEVDKVIYVSKVEIDKDAKGFSFRLEPGKDTFNRSGGKKKMKLYTEYGELAEWTNAGVC